MKLGPKTRLVFFVLCVAGALLTNNWIVNLLGYCLLICPAIAIERARRPHSLFLLVVLLPIAIMTFIVWPFFVGSPPGTDEPDFVGALSFAANTVLRLALVGGAFQAALATLKADEFAVTLRAWGIRGTWLLVLLSSRVCAPEFSKRADEVLTSSIAKGQLKNRKLWSRIQCLLASILPITIRALQNAFDQAEVWDDRKVLEKVHRLSRSHHVQFTKLGLAFSIVVVSWFLLTLLVRAEVFSISSNWIWGIFLLSSTSILISIYLSFLKDDSTTINESYFEALVDTQNPSIERTYYEGGNFTGRTAQIRDELDKHVDSDVVTYLGGDPSKSFSKLATNLRSELRLGGNLIPLELRNRLEPLLDQNLDSLSGGESTLAALGAALAYKPSVVGVDCAFEQLDPEGRRLALKILNRTNLPIQLADNRTTELAPVDFGFTSCKPQKNEFVKGFDDITGIVAKISEVKKVNVLLRNIHFSYPKAKPIICGVNATLEAGSIYHLSGKNGAGKSTLAKLLVGRLRPSDGTFEVSDYESSYSTAASSSVFWNNPGREFSYHFQNPNVELLKTTVKNELANSRIFESKKKGAENTVREWLNCFGLSDISTKHPQDMPFAMKKRIALAATFARETPWVILDEPTLGQDDKNCRRLVRIIECLSRAGVGFLIISHSSWFISQLSTRPIHLERGVVCE